MKGRVSGKNLGSSVHHFLKDFVTPLRLPVVNHLRVTFITVGMWKMIISLDSFYYFLFVSNKLLQYSLFNETYEMKNDIKEIDWAIADKSSLKLCLHIYQERTIIGIHCIIVTWWWSKMTFWQPSITSFKFSNTKMYRKTHRGYRE